ncbi:MAG: NRAMP family divalent metal transporter, partial [Chloroflexota bacterium]
RFSFLLLIMAVLGTTISPYMFFWQASEEVEEEIGKGQLARPRDPSVTGTLPRISSRDIRRMHVDTWAGMAFSQVTSWFIIITAAGSLHAAGKTNINTAAEAAQALEPLVRTFPHAGEIAKGIFALGIIGLGLLAVPIFAGSASYALADTFSWREGLYRKPWEAPQFYGVMILATLAGLGINFVGINAIKALVYAAVINGVVAVPLILLILLISNNRAIMGDYSNRRWVNVAGWCAFVAMAAAALALFVSWIP